MDRSRDRNVFERYALTETGTQTEAGTEAGTEAETQTRKRKP